jgi:hypothetical protein
MATLDPPSRCALADKTPNAYLQNRGHENNVKATLSMKSPTIMHLQMRTGASEKKCHPKIGQKRSIAYVDGTEEHEQLLLREGSPSVLKEPEFRRESISDKKQDVGGERESGSWSASKNEENDASKLSGVESEATTITSSAKEAVPKMEDDSGESSSADSKEMASTLLTSFHASQEGPLPIEEQFDILDEASQKTLETLVSRFIWRA